MKIRLVGARVIPREQSDRHEETYSFAFRNSCERANKIEINKVDKFTRDIKEIYDTLEKFT